MTDIVRGDQYWIDETGGHLTPLAADPTQRLRDWVDLFRDVVKAAEFLSKTPFVPREMLGKPADVAAAIMKGHELGMDPLDALANIYVINGRVGFYAEFMRRRIIQSGHAFTVIESSDHRAVVEGTRKDGPGPQRASFTAEQARNAGLKLGNYPADKLLARATSRLCRQVFPDVLSGSLIAEDLIDGLIPTEPTGAPEQHGVAGAPVARKRAPRKPRAAATQPLPVPQPAVAAAGTDDDDLLDDEPDSRPPEPVTAPVHPAAGTTNPPPPAPPSMDPTAGPDPNAFGDAIRATQQLYTEAGAEPEPPATPAQNRKMHTQFRTLDLQERDDRLAVTSFILGYPLTTSTGLTHAEADTLITILDEWITEPTNTTQDRIREILNQAAIEKTIGEETSE